MRPGCCPRYQLLPAAWGQKDEVQSSWAGRWPLCRETSPPPRPGGREFPTQMAQRLSVAFTPVFRPTPRGLPSQRLPSLLLFFFPADKSFLTWKQERGSLSKTRAELLRSGPRLRPPIPKAHSSLESSQFAAVGHHGAERGGFPRRSLAVLSAGSQRGFPRRARGSPFQEVV